MATVLAVDDIETNLDLLRSILVPNGYTVVEASDGAEALAMAEASHPDLIITDVLMPSMDGYEFVRRLRAKPDFDATPVIFYTAHFLERDARALAANCGVSEILHKPVDPADVLRVVDRVLRGGSPSKAAQPVHEAFDREHLALVTNKLAQQTEQLLNSNLRLKALTRLGLRLNLDRDQAQVAAIVCRAARHVVGASCAALVFVGEPGLRIQKIYCQGYGPPAEAALKTLTALEGRLENVFAEESRLGLLDSGHPAELGLPAGLPRIHSFLAVRVASPSHVHALLLLTNRLGASGFDAADQELATLLAAQLAVACDNLKLLEEAEQKSAALERQLAKEIAMEAALGQSEERLQAILDNTNAVVYLLSPDGRVLLANRAAQRFFGLPPAEILDRDLRHLLPPGIGETLWANDMKVLASGAAMESEDVVPRNGQPHTYLTTRFPLIDAKGSVYAIGGIATDFTEHKNVQEQLRHAQRMESIGRLAGGIAHDFNNLLTVINGYSSMLLEDSKAGENGTDDLRQIREAGQRAAELTRQLLAFSRRQVLDTQVLSINTVVTRFQSLLRRLIGEDISLVTDLDPGLAAVLADPAQIEQVLMNLAVNARDAMPDGGVLTIQSRNVILPAPGLPRPADAKPGDYVSLSVTDTGTGIPEEIRANIFEPFFTTKSKEKGTGLGLSTVYGIVQQSGGLIAVESAAGEGSRFLIYLPKAEGWAAEKMEAPDETRPEPGEETILLVEDELAVRRFTERALKKHGYRVISTSSPEEAIAAIENDIRLVDLLITDVVMPSMTGRQLADRLREIAPHLLILFISGYSDDVLSPKGVLPEGVEFLAKPFTPDGLAGKVRALLRTASYHVRVLIVDDDRTVRDILRSFLEKQGYIIDELADGRRVLEACARNMPDLAIVDLVMPEREGLETIREARERYPKLPIIAVTGKNPGYLKAAEYFGANAGIPKPLDLSRVSAQIRKLLNQNGSSDI